MSDLNFKRKKPLRSKIIAAGSGEAGRHFANLASRLAIDHEFVEIDRLGEVKNASDLDLAVEVELLWCHGRFSGEWVVKAASIFPNLSWIHSDFVGVDALPLDEFSKRGLLLTNGGGNFARPMAEWVVLGILASAKSMAWFVRNSDNAKWDNAIELRELEGAKVLLLGMGSVNSLVAQMLKGFGTEIVGWSRTLRQQGGDGIRRITGDAWQSEITQADYVVVGLPMTNSTRGIINKNVLESMKDDVTIINLSRGGLIDHDALVEMLDQGKIRFALLDAFEVEPLPSSDPLWRRENVLVLPHHSWSSPKVTENTVERMYSLLASWIAGEQIEDAVDYSAGY